jgi:hypothetical protein
LSFSRKNFDRPPVDLMTRAVEDAWRELQLSGAFSSGTNLEAIHAAMVRRVMMAVKEGERSQNRLKTLALRAVDARE